MNRTHLTPLGKLLAIVAMLAVGAVAGATGAAATKPHAEAWRCVVVRPGDTLWDLAHRVSAGDPRDAIDRIMAHNALSTPGITPGEALWVPADGPAYRASETECATTP